MNKNFVANINTIVTNNGGTVRVTVAQKEMGEHGSSAQFADTLREQGFKVEKNKADRGTLTVFGTVEIPEEPKLDEATLAVLCAKTMEHLISLSAPVINDQWLIDVFGITETQAWQIIGTLKAQNKISSASQSSRGYYSASKFARLWKPVFEGKVADFDYELMSRISLSVDVSSDYRGLTVEQLSEKFATDACDARKARVNVRLAIANHWLAVVQDGGVYKADTREFENRYKELAREAGVIVHETYAEDARAILGDDATEFQVQYLAEILECNSKFADVNEIDDHRDEIYQLLGNGVIEMQESTGCNYVLSLPLAILWHAEHYPNADFEKLFYETTCSYRNDLSREEFRIVLGTLEREGKLTWEHVDDAESGFSFDFFNTVDKIFEHKADPDPDPSGPESPIDSDLAADIERAYDLLQSGSVDVLDGSDLKYTTLEHSVDSITANHKIRDAALDWLECAGVTKKSRIHSHVKVRDEDGDVYQEHNVRVWTLVTRYERVAWEKVRGNLATGDAVIKLANERLAAQIKVILWEFFDGMGSGTRKQIGDYVKSRNLLLYPLYTDGAFPNDILDRCLTEKLLPDYIVPDGEDGYRLADDTAQTLVDIAARKLKDDPSAVIPNWIRVRLAEDNPDTDPDPDPEPSGPGPEPEAEGATDWAREGTPAYEASIEAAMRMADIAYFWAPVAEGKPDDLDTKLMGDITQSIRDNLTGCRGLTVEQIAEKFASDTCDARKARVNARLAIANHWLATVQDGGVYISHSREFQERYDDLAREAGYIIHTGFEEDAPFMIGPDATDYQIDFVASLFYYSQREFSGIDNGHKDEIEILKERGLVTEHASKNLYILGLPITILTTLNRYPHADFPQVLKDVKARYLNPVTYDELQAALSKLVAEGKVTHEHIDDPESGLSFNFYDSVAKFGMHKPEPDPDGPGGGGEPVTDTECDAEGDVSASAGMEAGASTSQACEEAVLKIIEDEGGAADWLRIVDVAFGRYKEHDVKKALAVLHARGDIYVQGYGGWSRYWLTHHRKAHC